ncbi:MAG: hypothetical protein D4R57_01150 [Verrucomicrobiales bacterium]|nr:MAG: hypothetical protein D4R57_01150 [Verrucomicrobiales bacterium]
MAEVTVRVEQHHIDAGNRSAIGSPLALAIRERLKKPPEIYISVWCKAVRIDAKFYHLPTEAADRDALFFNTGKMEPFNFQLSNKSINA